MKITSTFFINEDELVLTFIRSPGPGGQKVNKVATAVLLRFNVINSPSLPDAIRERLLMLLGDKISARGEIIIKASRYRTQLLNKQDALLRLQTLLEKAAHIPKKRKATKVSKSIKKRRLDKKKHHSQTKAGRSKKLIIDS